MRGPLTPSLDSPPFQRYGFPDVVTLADGAASTAVTYTVDGRYYERLIGVYFTFAAANTGDPRYVSVSYADAGSNVYAVSGAATAQSIDSEQDYFLSAFLGEDIFPVGGVVLAPLAPIILRPTDRVILSTPELATGDQFTGIRLSRERFFSDSPVPGVDYRGAG